MSSRLLRIAWPLLATTPVVLAGCSTSGTEAPAPRNLVFLCVDTLRADHLGAFGGPDDASPNIDRLAEESVLFERAVSHASWTLPSFAAVLTSTYTSTNGCWTKEDRLKGSLDTLPELFQQAGFDTYGVASHVFFREAFGLQQGFDAFDDQLTSIRGEPGWKPLSSPHVTERALAFLESRAEDPDPFLLWLHYFDPHLPYVDHAGVGAGPEHEHARYRTEITWTDRHVGRVLEALQDTGLAANTAVVFLSDHGEAWEEHPGVRRHAKSLFTEELTVPLMLRVPGLPARRVRESVRTIDLMPTLLELFGVPQPEQSMEGASLLPALLGGTVEPHPLLAEIDLHPDQHHRRALVHDGWKLIETRDGAFLLFDVENDPAELEDLAAQEPARVQELRRMLEGLEERARALGALFGGDDPVELTQDELDALQDLGY